MTATSTARAIELAVDTDLQTRIAVGDRVAITLPTNGSTTGTVSAIGGVATVPAPNTSGGSSSPTVAVQITPNDPGATGVLDHVPVQVGITTETVADVLTAPVTALLALSGGGYAVEVAAANATHTLVPVSIGLFDDSDGLVQISGPGLAEGQRIIVPAS
jgi:hypothetical protein